MSLSYLHVAVGQHPQLRVRVHAYERGERLSRGLDPIDGVSHGLGLRLGKGRGAVVGVVAAARGGAHAAEADVEVACEKRTSSKVVLELENISYVRLGSTP